MTKTRKRRQRKKGGDSTSSFDSSSSDGMSTEEAPFAGFSDIRAMIVEAVRESQVKMIKDIKLMLEMHKKELKEDHKEEHNELKEQLKKLNEGHILLHKQLERINGTSADVSPAPRLLQNEMQPPRFRLRITGVVKETVETKKYIHTNDGNPIEVQLYDSGNPIAPDHPLASAEVMMVVLNGEFNKDNNQYNWTKEDFEKSIMRPRQGNLAPIDGNQRIQSIVSNCTFYLDGGSQRHSCATIVTNSSNKNVRLGVMVLSHPKERVLEGLSNHFLVRDPPKKSNKQRKAQEQNGLPSGTQFAPLPASFTQMTGNGNDLGQLPHATNKMDNTPREGLQATEGDCQSAGGAHSLMITNNSMNQLISSPIGFPLPEPEYMNFNLFPVQLLWDRPFVVPIKRWNLLDQLMPLYRSRTKIHSGDSAAVRLMPEHSDLLDTYSQGSYQSLCVTEQASCLTKLMRDLDITTVPNQVMQAHQNRGVRIQPLEPDDEDDEPPLKRTLQKGYRLRFVNKVPDTYYTWEQIKADDGNLLKIALYDEDNMIVTSGPLSSVSVEVVALHGDFNAAGQDDWTSEEFSSYVVCPRSMKETPVLGGHLVLALSGGETSLDCAFFQKTSVYARTEKFKMGVTMAGTPEERVQEGISEPFWVRHRQQNGTTSTKHCPQLADGVCLLENTTQSEDYHEALVINHNIDPVLRDVLKNSDMDVGTGLGLQGTPYRNTIDIGVRESGNGVHPWLSATASPNVQVELQPLHFLQQCSTCGRALGPDIDIYIYRGEIAFCSAECRHRGLLTAESQEKQFLNMRQHIRHRRRRLVGSFNLSWQLIACSILLKSD